MLQFFPFIVFCNLLFHSLCFHMQNWWITFSWICRWTPSLKHKAWFQLKCNIANNLLFTKQMTRNVTILTILSKNFCPVTALSLQYTPPGPGRPHCKPSYWFYRNKEIRWRIWTIISCSQILINWPCLIETYQLTTYIHFSLPLGFFE